MALDQSTDIWLVCHNLSLVSAHRLQATTFSSAHKLTFFSSAHKLTLTMPSKRCPDPNIKCYLHKLTFSPSLFFFFFLQGWMALSVVITSSFHCDFLRVINKNSGSYIPFLPGFCYMNYLNLGKLTQIKVVKSICLAPPWPGQLLQFPFWPFFSWAEKTGKPEVEKFCLLSFLSALHPLSQHWD